MEKENIQTSTQPTEAKIIRIKIVGGSQADIYEIGKAMQEFRKTLPFRLEAIVTGERVELRDVNTLIRELWKLKKQLDKEKDKND